MNPPAASTDSPGDQARLIAALRTPALFGNECQSVTVLETHISYVLLTGLYAYKIKKRLDLGFLDFTTLAKRRYYCEQELKLNKRLAPALYLDVVPVAGTIDAPIVGGEGPALEYAVKMREFSQEALACRLLNRDELGAADIDALAAQVAAFHAAIDAPPLESVFGRPKDILSAALQNFSQIRPLLAASAARVELDALALWAEEEHHKRQNAFCQRQQERRIRECHGDLHLGNIARINGEMVIFDCIEFNDALRWIDVMSEVAFTVMDLQDRDRADLGQRFLNTYLEITGDYKGLSVLRFYLAYRAMVRAKIACLRAAQLGSGDATRSFLAEYHDYVALARHYARPPRPAIIITHGLAGTGKTTLSQTLLEVLGAVRIRTDIERKRLHGVAPRERSNVGVERGLYAPDVTEEIYRHVCAMAGDVVASGYCAIIDATFLKRRQRDLFRRLASDLQVPFLILSFTASEATLRKRITRRALQDHDASDADLAVLDHQLHDQEPLAVEERDHVVICDTEASLEPAFMAASWRAVQERIASA